MIDVTRHGAQRNHSTLNPPSHRHPLNLFLPFSSTFLSFLALFCSSVFLPLVSTILILISLLLTYLPTFLACQIVQACLIVACVPLVWFCWVFFSEEM